MPLYTGIDGAVKELTSLYTGVDGARRELTELCTFEDGAKKKIFSKKSEPKLIGFWNTLEHIGINTEIEISPSKIYDMWAIEPGGNGGNGGAKWGLYNGGQGGGGYGGAVSHLKFKPTYNTTLTIQIYQETSSDSLIIMASTLGILVRTYTNNRNNQPTNGEDAGAFNPNPSNGKTGIGGTAKYVAYEPTYCTAIIKEAFNGVPSERITTILGQVPHETPFTKPAYVADAGQDAYYSLNPDSICLGCGAGGGAANGGKGGKGAPGGIIIFEEDA